jgi:hypothetical protein
VKEKKEIVENLEKESKDQVISNYINTTKNISKHKEYRKEILQKHVESNNSDYLKRKQRHAKGFEEKQQEEANKFQRFSDILVDKYSRTRYENATLVILDLTQMIIEFGPSEYEILAREKRNKSRSSEKQL